MNPSLTYTRRELLASAAVAAAAVPDLPAAVRADAVILLWMEGGPSHVDTFDAKPDAPSGLRTDLGLIRSTMPGVPVTDVWPHMARTLRLCTVVRGIQHREGAHDRACHMVLTGLPAHPAYRAPSIGAQAAALTPGRCGYVSLAPEGAAFGHTGPGFLGSACEPRRVASAPRSDARYGVTQCGRDCLEARRLVEQGARFVLVRHPGWDTHCDNSLALRTWLAPPVDQGMSVLIEDLHERGMLSRTIVAWMGEFGRSPALNAMGGRDHWPNAGCAVLAGGGIPAGAIVGGTDRLGGEPTVDGITPSAIAGLLLRSLGVDHTARLKAPTGATIATAAAGPVLQLS